MESSKVFGRTSLGSQEILRKTGRLTQSERLVLFALGDQIHFHHLCEKLPALAPPRVLRALEHLIELDLAYDLALPGAAAAPAVTLTEAVIEAFLAQSPSDPVSIVMGGEALAAVDDPAGERRMRAAPADVPLAARANVAVPLGKLFPENRGGVAADGLPEDLQLPVPTPAPMPTPTVRQRRRSRRAGKGRHGGRASAGVVGGRRWVDLALGALIVCALALAVGGVVHWWLGH